MFNASGSRFHSITLELLRPLSTIKQTVDTKYKWNTASSGHEQRNNFNPIYYLEQSLHLNMYVQWDFAVRALTDADS